MDIDLIDQMIKDCIKRISKLNIWETDSLASIMDSHEKNKHLSDKQMEQLDKIWEKVTS